MTAEEMTNDATKQHRKLNHEYKHLKKKKNSSFPFFGQLAASAKHGCVMETATARTTRTRTTVTPWCASCLTTHARPTTPSVSPLRSCATAPTTVRTAQTRNYVVKCIKTHLTQNHRTCSAANVLPPFLMLDLCALDNGGCSHNCTIIPGEGFMCSCPLGMELGADNKTCQIQSFCAKHLKCSQKCEQEKSSVKCSCYEGWELESDMESCKSTGKNNKVSSIFPVTLLYTCYQIHRTG